VSEPPKSAVDVRAEIVEALGLDLVGPWPGHALSAERLPRNVRPSSWYLTGFLIPTGTAEAERGDEDESDDLDAVPKASGLSEESNEDRKAAKKGYFASSMGLSFLMPREATRMQVTVRWGDYTESEFEDPEGKKVDTWQRTAREANLEVVLSGKDEPVKYRLPGHDGLQLHVVERPVAGEGFEPHLPAGTRSVSVFLVNDRVAIPSARGGADTAYVFQAQIEVVSTVPFVPRPDLRGTRADQWDERVADLHYADVPEFATGHGVSADWDLVDGLCRVVRTTWIPAAQVERTETVAIPDVELGMVALGDLPDGQAALEAIGPLVKHYRAWIAEQKNDLVRLNGTRRETAEGLLHGAEVAADRIEAGVSVLANDPLALEAFKVANRAVARALTKRLGVDSPSWRAFQLAFMLLNLPGVVDPASGAREIVDLLFFPTGGGKTEAYLGLAAFTMVLRRLRHPDDEGHAGAGVSVIMRYTLRLLTLDQLSRAAGLVCALELEREQAPERYGRWPFEIGLWVGKAATPNVLGEKGDGRQDTARTKVTQFKNDPGHRPSPIPLENCPWCGRRFMAQSFTLQPNADKPQNLRIVCTNLSCDFIGSRALPIVAVDECIYRRLPAFLIATVDKFASIPWVGASGVLLGGADRYKEHEGFFGSSEPNHGKPLKVALSPPDLVIQDELHLISGPLGTMAGLYEAAIEALCTRELDGRSIRPKIVASTATVRRADEQVSGLFGRPLTNVFPPPGPDRKDSFFATVRGADEVPARLYLGVAAQGRNPKVVMRRVWLALMGAAQRAYELADGDKNIANPADPYMTMLGYFNSLRELGGARRILEEEVRNTVKAFGGRKRVGESEGLFRDRKSFSEVMELTSRVSTDKIAEARRRLEGAFHEKDHVDCAIATNMISVGLDIQRLGLMVVVGQPKTHSEYIQATSRVGRDSRRPGLVVTLLNAHKSRDRSHYERFRHYHETFYGSVEVASVTPFSARALDRGFAGALVLLARHSMPELVPPLGASRMPAVRAALEERLRGVFMARVRKQFFYDETERDERLRSVQSRVAELLDAWTQVVQEYGDNGVEVQYQSRETMRHKSAKPLLREMLEQSFDSEAQRKFRVNRSLRDVEPNVNLFLKDLNNQDVEDPS
jgi:Helicase conserved C-terminal domain